MAKVKEASAQLEELGLDAEAVVADYRLAYRSRQASLIGRREVMAGKAKFGIFGDGKELPQVAMARAWQPGDFRSGYYRDQTLMLALGINDIDELFAQLYAHADVEREPASAGRMMNAHFGSRSLTPEGDWKFLTDRYNTTSDVSPTGSQMPRLVGLGYASVLYRELEALQDMQGFSKLGGEVAWGTIGNATCAEGMFWESVNAVGVLGGPVVLSIWDDGYGISVPNDYQLTKSDVGALLEGFRREEAGGQGFEIFSVQGWDYPELVRVYAEAARIARQSHVPSLIHVRDLTQPQGHSTSGSHERYKTPERLAWEREHDGLHKMRIWMIESGLCGESELEAWEQEDRLQVEEIRERAWEAFIGEKRAERDDLADILEEIASAGAAPETDLAEVVDWLRGLTEPQREDLAVGVRKALVALYRQPVDEKQVLIDWHAEQARKNEARYGSDLYSSSDRSPTKIQPVWPDYAEDAPERNGYEILNEGFDAILARDPRVIAFGEDLGQIGGVNQGMRGLQEKHGLRRVTDTGIRECTILGQAIGMAMRGLRPIAEIQYLDYILYALQIMSDDLATLRWRSGGGQMAPVVVRTRGHRLEGVWHSGSPMAGLIHLLRGMHICVPRDMTRAIGFYNTLLDGDDPGLVVEVLNGYRLKERLPDNLADMRLPLGQPEILREGQDVTLVTYGPCCRIALAAAEVLAGLGIELEVIDVQTLLPFDVEGRIGRSLARTGRIVFLDEDVPGGTTAYMLQEVIEGQGGYYHLDSEPRTLSAKAHRPAYASDGDYFSKPNAETVIRCVIELMNELDPERYPLLDSV